MKRNGKAALLMRQDGYVTARELADATGKTLESVHAGIREEKIPGARIGWGWYVDIHRYYAALIGKPEGYPVGSTIEKNLAALKLLTGKPAKALPKVEKQRTARR